MIYEYTVNGQRYRVNTPTRLSKDERIQIERELCRTSALDFLTRKKEEPHESMASIFAQSFCRR